MGTSDLSSPREGGVPPEFPAGSWGIVDDGMLRITRAASSSRLMLAGDIDEPSIPFLAAALAGTADGSGEVHVDLAGVGYCGLAGLRVLTGLGGGQDHLPRRLVLHHLPAHLHEVLRIMGWDTSPGLALASTSASPAAAGEPSLG
jgi:ABC-type transporter Mla MlaB component